MGTNVDELLAGLRRGEFHIDCVQIDLLRTSDGKCFSGPGYIHQKLPHGFEVKIYSEGKLNLRDIAHSWTTSVAGVLYKDDSHFSLTAIDVDQRRWTADRIIQPAPSGHVDGKGFLVVADCDEIVLVNQRASNEKSNWIELFSFESIEFPCNESTQTTVAVGKRRRMSRDHLNVAEFLSNELDFCFDDHDGLRVFATSKTLPLQSKAENRIMDAITFVLGIRASWAAITRSEGAQTLTKFFSPEQRKKPHAFPPFRIELVDQTGSVWRMFDLFLNYILKDTSSDVHNLSRQVNGITSTKESMVEVQAMAVSIAVESLLDGFFEATGVPDAETLAGLEQLLKHIKVWDGDPNLIHRAEGSVRAMKNPRCDDRLRELVRKNVIAEAHRVAWTKLRHTSAHGDWGKYGLQELLDLNGQVLVLFNQLIFHLIGYSGKQSDYGTRSGPTIDYPTVTGETGLPVTDSGVGPDAPL